jgi:hypothetical protein
MYKKTEPITDATNNQKRARGPRDPRDDVVRLQRFENGLRRLLRPRKKKATAWGARAQPKQADRRR